MAALRVYRGRKGLSRTLTLIGTTIAALLDEQRAEAHPKTSQEMLEAETRRRAQGTAINDMFIAQDIIRAHMDCELKEQAAAEARERYREAGIERRIENRGWWPVTIILPGGLRLKMTTPYLRPTRKGLRGRPRGAGKRRGGGVGAYPVLQRLGIQEEATPLTRSIVARQTVLCSSYAEANEQLSRDGLTLDVEQMAGLATGVGKQALELRDEALAAALEGPLPEQSMVEGQRIRVSVDGGRARTRRTHHKAKKQKNGRRPFTLEWREPRIITVDVLDDRGEMDRRWRPIYEVSMGEADRVFEVLCGLLRLIGAHRASLVVFVSDGAEWIWNRVEELFRKAEVPRDRVELVLDYYHATEHIGDALAACKSLTKKQRAGFVRFFNKELLTEGGPANVIEKLRGFARGRRSTAVKKEIEYLEGHLEHMEYARLRLALLPIGSGVVESAVRRVINLRFKSSSMCWCKERLEALMYLRAILKSGRWDDAMNGQLSGQHILGAVPSGTPQSHQNEDKVA